MFNNNDSIYLMTVKKNDYKIFLLNCNKEVQSLIANVFNSPLKDGIENGYDEIKFQVGYQLENDEVWIIENFDIPKEIIDAIENPDTLSNYVPADINGLTTDGYAIKAIFMGKKIENQYHIAFQRFEKSQMLRKSNLSFIFSNDRFVIAKEFCFNINETIDVIYSNNKFKFVNYTNANKVFSLKDYYRIATQNEVDQFKNKAIFEIESESDFTKLTDGVQVRTQIAKILDSGVLDAHNTTSLQNIASTMGISLKIKGDKLQIPKDRKEMKELLVFLSEKMYNGPLTGQTMISSSTRVKE